MTKTNTHGPGAQSGSPSTMRKEPPGLTGTQRLFRRAVINLGLAYPEFAEAIGWEGSRQTLATRVGLKVRGRRPVTNVDIRLIEAYGKKIGQDLFEEPTAEAKRERVKGGA